MSGGNTDQRSGFTLIERLMVIAIIAVLAALMWPAVQLGRPGSAKFEAYRRNLQQLTIAVMMYASDYDSHYPPAGK